MEEEGVESRCDWAEGSVLLMKLLRLQPILFHPRLGLFKLI